MEKFKEYVIAGTIFVVILGILVNFGVARKGPSHCRGDFKKIIRIFMKIQWKLNLFGQEQLVLIGFLDY